MAAREGYGWAPYWFPMLAFLLFVEVGNRSATGVQLALLVLKVAVPAGLLLWYARRGLYPELRGYPAGVGGIVGDVAVGLLGAALWVVPFLWLDSLRPVDPGGFDPSLLGESLGLGESGVVGVLALRAIGYAAVTPFVEELFVRSWLIRYIDVFDVRKDFRDVPMARFTWRSFLVVTGYFVFTHADWEWGVMLAWTLLTLAWFYRRGHLAPLVLVHAVTNGSIFAFVVLFDGYFLDAEGVPIDLWFFL